MLVMMILLYFSLGTLEYTLKTCKTLDFGMQFELVRLVYLLWNVIYNGFYHDVCNGRVPLHHVNPQGYGEVFYWICFRFISDKYSP